MAEADYRIPVRGTTLHHNTFGGGATFTVRYITISKRGTYLVATHIVCDDGSTFSKPYRTYSLASWFDFVKTSDERKALERT